MKKTFLLLAILLTSPLHASQPTTEDIIQLPSSLFHSVGYKNIPEKILFVISSFLFGQKTKFLIAKKGRSRSKASKTSQIYNWYFIPRPDTPNPQLLDRDDISIDDFFFDKDVDHDIRIYKEFWISTEDDLYLTDLTNQKKQNEEQYVKVFFLGKFCCVQVHEKPKNMEPMFSFSKHFNEKNNEKHTIDIDKIGIESIDITKRPIIDYNTIEKQHLHNKTYSYYALFSHKKSKLTNNQYVHRLCEYTFVPKDNDKETTPSFEKDYNNPYRVDHVEEEVEEDDEELTIYD